RLVLGRHRRARRSPHSVEQLGVILGASQRRRRIDRLHDEAQDMAWHRALENDRRRRGIWFVRGYPIGSEKLELCIPERDLAGLRADRRWRDNRLVDHLRLGRPLLSTRRHWKDQ